MLLFPRGEPWGVNKLAPGGGRHLGEVLPETFTIHSTCPTETRPSADKSRCARARIHAAYINPRQSTEFRRRKRHSFSPASAAVPGLPTEFTSRWRFFFPPSLFLSWTLLSFVEHARRFACQTSNPGLKFRRVLRPAEFPGFPLNSRFDRSLPGGEQERGSRRRRRHPENIILETCWLRFARYFRILWYLDVLSSRCSVVSASNFHNILREKWYTRLV